jgi:hypothetical protein
MCQSILNNIQKLPDEIISIIKEYIPHFHLVFVNKQNYKLYHPLIKKYIYNYENYIRDIVREDHSFVFEQILNENYKRWMTIKKYTYKNIIYNNYIYFIISYCIDNQSNNCRIVLVNFLREHGLCQNQHKKNILKNIRWKN